VPAASLVFVATSIIVCAHDRNEPTKRAIAERWLAELARARTGRISWQVLTEFYSVVTHPQKLALADASARTDIEALAAWHPLAPDVTLFNNAWTVQDRYNLSWWDALIVTAALRQGCTRLLTEDLQHGLQVEGVRGGGTLSVVNPFAPDAPQPN
jgi:predicted nucleic acid-binding protein